jgi:hypothetical protein
MCPFYGRHLFLERSGCDEGTDLVVLLPDTVDRLVCLDDLKETFP